MVKVELTLHARNLQNVAGLLKGKSDPFAVVTKVATTTNEKAEVLGKTEVIENTLNPDWVKVFTFEYNFGSPAKLAVSLYDQIEKGDNKSMGAAVFDISQVLSSRGGTRARKVKGGGMLYARIKESEEGNGTLKFKLKGLDLKNMEGFGIFRKSDPFFEIYRKLDDNNWDNIYRSNVVDNELSPEWEEGTIDLSILCGGDRERPIKFTVFDHEKKGNHKVMGEFKTTLDDLLAAARDKNKNFKMKRDGNDSGTIIVESANITGPTFADYIAGGCRLNVVVAIDFTGSNGDPREPGTLHYLNDDGGGQLNDYQKAIKSIVGILSKYDTDQKYPVLGFGAKFDGKVNHAFQCGDSEEVEGVDGIMEAYRATFQSGFIMSSPTVINEVIEAAAKRAEANLNEAVANGSQAYTVLVIICDGCVSFIPSTTKCLLETSDSPISIVIVGVGEEDFSNMSFLDNLHTRNKRDITQFVCFNEHSSNPVDLSSATLEEIPTQLEGYFLSRGILPNPVSQISLEEMNAEEEEEEIDLTLEFVEEEIVVAAGGNDFSEW